MRFLWPLLVFAGLIVFLAMGLGKDPTAIPSPLVGRPAPAIDLPSLQNDAVNVSLADYQGKPFVVNVWGSWCPACYDEHSVLLEIASQKQLPMIGLNWKDTREAATKWLTSLGNPYVVTAFDPIGDVGINWGVYGAPETFLVGADGRILHKHIGPMTQAIWQQDFLSRVAL